MERKKVDSKLLLFTLALILIILLLLNFLLENNRKDEIWNYKEIKSATDVIYKGKRVTDRETFYTLETIVNQYLDSYINVYNEDKLMYEDYYNYLWEYYKKHLSKKEYKEIATNFLNKFYININSDYESMDTSNILKAVYEFENNIYLCKLIGNKSGETGYIAFQIDANRYAFKIVYIE